MYLLAASYKLWKMNWYRTPPPGTAMMSMQKRAKQMKNEMIGISTIKLREVRSFSVVVMLL